MIALQHPLLSLCFVLRGDRAQSASAAVEQLYGHAMGPHVVEGSVRARLWYLVSLSSQFDSRITNCGSSANEDCSIDNDGNH